ncbi:M24 family metallopeptidase [Mesobacillus maritimus]|uniref:M24 family metallopeptidase n=1 Tax=Mesobacillus maritimus TaxID=1643336 RepID=UPI00204213F4|nr:M24 family metallopeptidase [Mesobacillus maritimus]MCM3584395.1 M24 family metallopeptidase [Mesobacillus maritimus]MCM3669188.1 M24 family metallopeptidase [Mesobacillus maritimus]
MNFGTEEYKERIRKTKESMAKKGIEVLLITDPANINYLSGYDAWSFYVHQMLVVIDDEDQPFWIGRNQDANGARMTTWLFHENIFPYPDEYVQSTTLHPMKYVAEILKQIGQDKRTIGVEMENYYFTARCYEALKCGLPNATISDGSLLVNWLRLIKSDVEIEMIKRAAKISEIAMTKALEMVDVGVRECDVAAEIFRSQIRGTNEFGGDYPAIVPLLPSGERSATPHLTWTDDPYESGDIVTIELAGCYKRYHSPLARTISLGKPADKIQILSDVVVEGLNACLEMIKPGIASEEIESTFKQTISKFGLTKDSRLGYSMGLNYPPDWGEHTVSIRSGDKTILKPNMTFHLIPGIWLDDYGFEASESIRITENGCETFASLPRQLFVKEQFLPLINSNDFPSDIGEIEEV